MQPDIAGLDLSILTRDEREQLYSYLAEVDRRNARRMFWSLFPEDGPYRRELYPKHMEFFRVGAKYRERCFMAANRCKVPTSFIETDTGERPCAEVWTSADARVLSLAGESLCAVRPQDGLFLGIEQAFRVILDSGRFFDCSQGHRILTAAGWRDLSWLVRHSSGLRCWHRREDYQASCDADGCLGDAPLRQIGGIDLEQFPSQGAVRGRAPLIFEHTDEVARRLRHSLDDPAFDRLSTPDDLRRFVGLFALFAGPSSKQPVVRLSDNIRELRQLALASDAHLQADDEFRHDLSVDDACRGAVLTRSRAASCTPKVQRAARRSGAQWCDGQALGGSIREWFCDAAHIPIFYPSRHPDLVGGETIAAIVPLGLQPIIDAHIPGTNNYRAGGVYHHNTGKTFSGGGFETTCHLTGLYPPWWQGKRFDHPVRWWAAGKSNETTRDVIQATLMGNVAYEGQRKTVTGTGVIPGGCIGPMTWKRGVADLADTIRIRHVTGGWSTLGLKSYEQGRGSFEGTAQEGIWFDEEPPLDVYGEALIRTATTGGIIMVTFTPLEGLSEVVLQFMPADQRPDLAI